MYDTVNMEHLLYEYTAREGNMENYLPMKTTVVREIAEVNCGFRGVTISNVPLWYRQY